MKAKILFLISVISFIGSRRPLKAQARALTALALALFGLLSSLQAGTIFVDTDATGLDDGSTWANAYPTLQDALAAATSGDEIWVAEGTYYPDEGTGQTNDERTSSFNLIESVALYGGFDGTETLLAERDPDAHLTILSGDIGSHGDNTDNSYHVVYLDDGDDATFQDVLIDGFTITGGYADLTTDDNHQGAGIDNRENLTLRQVSVSNNFAQGHSGGIVLRLGACQIEDSFISNNEANGSGGGGGIRAKGPVSLTILRCQFDANIINAAGDSTGGGALIVDPGALVTIQDASFTNNQASLASGGALFIKSSDTTITNCFFQSNIAKWGGGIGNTSSSPTITNSSFQGNSAINNGGGISNLSSSPTITNVSFQGNSAGIFGGGLESFVASPTLINCSFQGNSAGSNGGGIGNDASSLTLVNCILWNNAANGITTSGSASVRTYQSTPTYAHCLIANSGGSASWDSAFGADGGNNLDADPFFIAEVDPLTAPTTGGDLSLRNDSPAINAGDNSANSTTTDLVGNTRKVGIIDLGAYERQGILYVDADATQSNPNGRSWADAYPNLQDALAVANSGDEIWVAEGTYYPDQGTGQTNDDRTSSFTFMESVTLYGGFDGTETHFAERDPNTHLTILSGDIGSPGDNTDNSYHVVYLDDGADATFQDVLLDGVTITGGYADLTTDDNHQGAGIDNRENLTLRHVSVSNNFAQGQSGGIALRLGACQIEDSLISGNEANGVGGGGGIRAHSAVSLNILRCQFDANIIDNSNSSAGGGALMVKSGALVTIQDTSFTSNQASSSARGGALRIESSDTTITNCSFQNNSADFGGGIYTPFSSPTITDASFQNNTADFGGGIYNLSSSPTITNASFQGNSTTARGGGIFNDSSSPTITNCSFEGNSAEFGGGIFNDSSSPALTNASFQGNSAVLDGGGIFNFSSSSPTITNCSFQGNSAIRHGGGIRNFRTSSPPLTNCILWNNAANGITTSTSASVANDTSTPTYAHCLIANSGGSASWDSALGTDSGNNLDADPLFVAEVDPLTAPTTGGDLSLLSDSPAINVGDNSTNSTTTDLVGNTRKVGIIDLGVYELQGALYVDADAIHSNPSGSSWTRAYPHLQDALAAASPGDQIWVAEGTYYPDEGTGQTNDARSSSFTLMESVTLYGGFDGTETLFAERDPNTHLTILSGDIGSPGDNTDNSYHVVSIDDGDDATFQDVVIDGVTITGGYADLTTNDNDQGAGIDNRENLTLRQVSVSNNYALGHGGGIALHLGTCRIEDSLISGNEANGVGGGGGIRAEGPVVLNILRCQFDANIIDNFEISFEVGGGALKVEPAALVTIEDTSFTSNQAKNSARGGALHIESSDTTITNCSFKGNHVHSLGGGIYNSLSSPTITNASFQGNRAGFGGGIYNKDSSPTITNASFQSNFALLDGGGIRNDENSSPTLTNCILWNNAANGITTSTSASVANNTSTPTYANCLIANSGGSASWASALGTDGGNNLDADPLFAAEVDPLTAPTTGGDLRLLAFSPAIDAGDNSANSTTTELAGNARKVGTIDLGAFEQQGPLYVDADATHSNPNGSSWADAYPNLQDALAAASPGDQIWVAEGTYYPDQGAGQTNDDRSSSFNLMESVVLYGGFDGTETLLTERDPDTHITILSGDIGSPGDTTDNSYHVVSIDDGDDATFWNVFIDGVTITGGYADLTTNNNYQGAGIFNRENLTLRQVSVSNNYAQGQGGGIALRLGTCRIEDSLISGNEANGKEGGGGIRAHSAVSLDILRCQFDANTIDNSNSSAGGGALMVEPGALVTIQNASFTSNQAKNAARGGALRIESSDTTITNCSFQGNNAINDGGGIFNHSSSPTLTNCILWNNAANGITTSTGASVANDTSTPTYAHCLIANSGGSASWASALGTDGGNNLDADPLFVAEVDPLTAPSTGGDLRLLVFSPAIDAGDNSANSTTTDLAGETRIVGSAIDIGAYEVDNVTDTDGDGVPDLLDNCPLVYNPDQADSDVPDSALSPVAAWHFEEGSGSTATDVVDGHIGTLNSASWNHNGRFGGALAFLIGGSNVVVPSSTDFDLPDQLTISVWVKPSAFPNTINRILTRGGGDYQLRLNSGKPQFLVLKGGAFIQSRADTPLAVDEWTHLAATWDGQGDGLLKIYVNGAEVTYEAQGNAAAPIDTSGANLLLGNPDFERFVGLMDQLLLLDHAASDAEIVTLATTGMGNGIGDACCGDREPFSAWICSFFPGETDPAIIGASADPNLDGLPNILAFVFAADPTAHVPALLPTATRDATYLIVEFARSDRATSLAPHLAYGTDLQNWTTAVHGDDGVIIEVEDDGFGTDFGGIGIDRVTVKIPHGGGSGLFWKLGAELPFHSGS